MLNLLFTRLQGKKYCPLVKRSCLKEGCTFYQKLLQGNDPQTNKVIEEDCVYMLGNYWLGENFVGLIRLQQAVESNRNETVKAINVLSHAIAGTPIDDLTEDES